MTEAATRKNIGCSWISACPTCSPLAGVPSRGETRTPIQSNQGGSDSTIVHIHSVCVVILPWLRAQSSLGNLVSPRSAVLWTVPYVGVFKTPIHLFFFFRTHCQTRSTVVCPFPQGVPSAGTLHIHHSASRHITPRLHVHVHVRVCGVLCVSMCRSSVTVTSARQFQARTSVCWIGVLSCRRSRAHDGPHAGSASAAAAVADAAYIHINARGIAAATYHSIISRGAGRQPAPVCTPGVSSCMHGGHAPPRLQERLQCSLGSRVG